MGRKVYVVSDGGHDYSGAAKYGEIVFCTKNVIPKNDVHQMFRELREALKDMRSDDYLMISSLTTLCVVASNFLVDRFGELHLLLYRGNGEYYTEDLVYPSFLGDERVY